MKKVFFLVNKLDEVDFAEYTKKYLSGITVSIGESLPKYLDDYDLIILWNYRKILRNISDKKNIILFHSSDLPHGKGWAPIYYSLYEGRHDYVISGILAADEVDSGDIIIQARFRIKDNYTADIIRRFDNEITIIMIKKILERFYGIEIKGIKQEGKGTFYKRRRPEDNEIDQKLRFSELVNHLRACEKTSPAFFYYNKTKYLISIEPELKPKFPEDLKIKFFDHANPLQV